MDLKNFSTLLDTFTPNPLSHSSPEDKLKQYEGPKDVNNKPDSQSHTQDRSSTTLINQFSHLEIGRMYSIVAEGP